MKEIGATAFAAAGTAPPPPAAAAAAVATAYSTTDALAAPKVAGVARRSESSDR